MTLNDIFKDSKVIDKSENNSSKFEIDDVKIEFAEKINNTIIFRLSNDYLYTTISDTIPLYNMINDFEDFKLDSVSRYVTRDDGDHIVTKFVNSVGSTRYYILFYVYPNSYLYNAVKDYVF